MTDRPALLALLRSASPAEALPLAEQACAAPGEGEVEAWHRRAQLLADAGRREQALVCWRRALTLPPDPTWGLQAALSRIALLQSLDRPREIAETAELGLRHAPGHTPLWLHRALALESLERPAEALTALDRALAEDPTLPGAAYHRARLRARAGLPGALDDLREALARDPGLVELARLEEDLAPLHADPAFAALVAPAKPTRRTARAKAKVQAKVKAAKAKVKAKAKPRARPAAKAKSKAKK